MKKLLMTIPLVILLCFTFSCQKQVEEGLTEEKAKAITDQVLKIWNEGDLAKADELYGPEYVRHHPTPSVNASLDDLKNMVISLRTSFPDCTFTFDDILVKGDKIVTFATFSGTNTGPLDDLPTTGKKVRVSGVYIYYIVNGKIAEEWTFFNLLDYYQQLGYTLTPPGPPEKN